eukprot:gene8231-12705_t
MSGTHPAADGSACEPAAPAEAPAYSNQVNGGAIPVVDDEETCEVVDATGDAPRSPEVFHVDTDVHEVAEIEYVSDQQLELEQGDIPIAN